MKAGTPEASAFRGAGESSTQAESLHDRAVALDIGLLEVVEQTATLTHEQQQPTTAVVVVLVALQVLGQVGDAVRQQRDLHLRGAGVTLDGGVLGDDLLLGLGVGTDGHASSLLMSLRGAPGHIHPGTLDPRPLHGNTKGYQRRGAGRNRRFRPRPVRSASGGR